MAHSLGGVQASKVGANKSKTQDTSSIVTGKPGGIGYANPTAFKTDAQLEEKKRLSFEKATGDNKAGYNTMTDSEREDYRVKSMGIAPTKTDDYSDWGIARKAAADEAHAEGNLSAQDKKNQKTIDARDASRHNYEVTKPKEQKAAQLRAHSAADSKKNKYKTNLNKSASSKSISRKPVTYSKGLSAKGAYRPKEGLGKRDSKGLAPSFQNQERYGSPGEQKQATLAKDGWTPNEITEFSGNIVPFEAMRVQNALPGVQSLTNAEAAAQYGGSGSADAMSMQMISGTVMSPSYRNAMYGQGLGGEKTKSLLPYGSGGQTGAGPAGLSALGPILTDIQLGGKGY